MLQLTLLEREEVELEFTTYSIVEQLSRVISTQENQAILKDIEIQFEKPREDIMGVSYTHLESIGQVASQTLNSMQVINEVVKIPVLRPV